MSAQAHPQLALRPMLPADATVLAEIFRASIVELTADDYSEAQQDAWAAAAEDEAAFAKKLTGQLTLIGTLGGSPVGFVSLADTEKVDMLYVHPAAAGQGVGAMLTDAIEKLAAARGAKKLKVDASDNALEFFKKRGYIAQQRSTVNRGGEWFANTTMEKQLAAQGQQ
jgi:putative acetyltransferase